MQSMHVQKGLTAEFRTVTGKKSWGKPTLTGNAS